jgi:hypothetical protein
MLNTTQLPTMLALAKSAFTSAQDCRKQKKTAWSVRLGHPTGYQYHTVSV